ncbi:hypothetical protein ACMFMG_005285 [Clarireedia jacksonii]
MDERKLFVIIGITGNQGGSVARTFLDDPEMRSKYRLRGITRDLTSSQSQNLASQGVEMVSANLHDSSTLLKAFEGAHAIFSVTDFWKPYLDEKNQAKAREQGKHIGELCYELEYEQGRNIADAASQIPALERLVVSMVCSTKQRSNGFYSKIYHFDAKADMISYIKSKHPALAAKMSELNMGVFMTAWRFTPSLMAPQKMEDGVHVLRLPCNPDTPIPFVDASNDTGPFVRALLALKPGIQLYGAVTLMSWNEWLTLWGKIMGKKTRFQHVSVDFWEEEMSKWAPQGFGTELAEMFEFMGKYGYDGGDLECKRWWEVSSDPTSFLHAAGINWSLVGD